jgi:hypothetical protein
LRGTETLRTKGDDVVASGTTTPEAFTDRGQVPVGGAPLTAEALQAFLSEQGSALARGFLAWAAARRLSEADAWDAMQQVVTVVQQRLAAGTGTAADLRPARLFLRGKRRAQRLPAAPPVPSATPSERIITRTYISSTCAGAAPARRSSCAS